MRLIKEMQQKTQSKRFYHAKNRLLVVKRITAVCIFQEMIVTLRFTTEF